MKQKKYFIALAFLVLALVLMNCASDEPKPANATVYVGGQTKTSSQWVAAFTKDGVMNKVGNPDNVYSYAQSMTVSGKDVYLAGYSADVATYWKNSEKHTIPLSAGAERSECAGGIVVKGNDVYVVVREMLTTGSSTIKYVKNGVATICTPTIGGNMSTSTIGNGLAVVGSDVYVAGSGNDANDVSHAGYWKNGAFVPFETQNSYAQAIKVIDGDIYVAGYYYDNATDTRVAVYWKNGNIIVLGSLMPGDCTSAYDIEVADESVYVSGYHVVEGGSKAVYWKDGEEITLLPEETEAYAENIEIRNGDVYVVAECYESNTGFIIKLLKNEVPVAPFDGTTTDFYGVALCLK